MSRHASFLASAGLAVTLVAACSKSNTSTQSTANAQAAEQAHEYYVKRVHPLMGSCLGCHAEGGAAPQFFAKDGEDAYVALSGTVGLIAQPKDSPLIKYVHADRKILLSPEQRNVLTQWLTLEANARGLQGAIDKPKTITDAYKQFADCMNFDVWNYYRMGDISFVQTDQEGPCLGCHSYGQGGAWLSAGSRESFDRAKTFPYIQKYVVGKLDERGSFESLVASNRFVEKGNEVCPKESITCHPVFGLPPEIVDQLEGFVDTTLLNLVTNNCKSGIVTVTPDAGTDGGTP